MRISVITVCRNAVETIAQTIESVLAQDWPDIEYIVVDGMSGDGTMAVIERYRDRIATLIHEPDAGIYDAMNKGIRASTGEFVTFANADDFYVDDQVLGRCARLIEAHPEADVFYGDCYVQAHGRRILLKQPARLSRLRLFIRNLKCQQQMFVRRALFTGRVGFFESRYRLAGDYDWNLRALLVEKAACCNLPFPVCVFRAGGRADTQVAQRYRETHELRKRYYSAWERACFIPAKCAYELVSQVRTGEFKLPDRFAVRQ